MVRPFPPHVALREDTKLLVDERNELVESGLIAVAPCLEQFSGIRLRAHDSFSSLMAPS
jgi:hypothetical protein